jgi:hypothetical protein
VDLAQLIRFLVVELTHPDSNPIFDMGITFTANYSFSERQRVPVDSEALLMADFVNFKIKSAQSFKYAHRVRVYVRVFIWMNDHTYMSIYVYTVFLKKNKQLFESTSPLSSDPTVC